MPAVAAASSPAGGCTPAAPTNRPRRPVAAPPSPRAWSAPWCCSRASAPPDRPRPRRPPTPSRCPTPAPSGPPAASPTRPRAAAARDPAPRRHLDPGPPDVERERARLPGDGARRLPRRRDHGRPHCARLPPDLAARRGHRQGRVRPRVRGSGRRRRHHPPPHPRPAAHRHHGNAAIPDTDGGALDHDATWDLAVGPTQFIPSSLRTYGADGNGDGRADPDNVFDAGLATARYLCSSGGDLPTRPPATTPRSAIIIPRTTSPPSCAGRTPMPPGRCRARTHGPGRRGWWSVLAGGASPGWPRRWPRRTAPSWTAP